MIFLNKTLFFKNKNGKISFSEFILSTSFVLKKDSNEAKKIMETAFDIYNVNGGKTVDKAEMQRLIRSIYEMNELSNLDSRNKLDKVFDKLDKDKNGGTLTRTGVVKFHTCSTATYKF